MPRKYFNADTPPAKDITGEKFHQLTAIRFLRWKAFPSEACHELWLWKCVCGVLTEALKLNVTTGHTKSCGCFLARRRIESHTTHGDARKGHKHPLYVVWSGMKQRCEDKNHPRYKDWGGRGIRVLWSSYQEFKIDMLPTYRSGLTIERKNNNGDYCKQNCKWATHKEQASNRRPRSR